jgi:myo-inositol-1(or 4)-monophosphatase
VRELVTELALGLREHVLPHLGSHAGRAHLPAGTGGDVTFAIDEEAEGWLERYLAEHAPAVAYYSEDRGLCLPSGMSAADPQADRRVPGGTSWVLLVDPVDGTRPAMAGLESCCVAVAAAPLGDGAPTMREVEVGCVVEIKSGTSFVAERGKGVEIRRAGRRPPSADLSQNTDITRLFWTLGFRGRPAEPLVKVLSELIDTSSVGGAVFDLGSAAFDLTRIVTGQLDAYLDVGSRMIEEAPALRQRFEQVGGGAVLNNSPYDLAAAVLCVEEAGGVVTDAHGKELAQRPLLGSGHEFQMSCVAASNPELHEKILQVLERGFARIAPSA